MHHYLITNHALMTFCFEKFLIFTMKSDMMKSSEDNSLSPGGFFMVRQLPHHFTKVKISGVPFGKQRFPTGKSRQRKYVEYGKGFPLSFIPAVAIMKAEGTSAFHIPPKRRKAMKNGQVFAKDKAEEELQHKISRIVPGTIVEGTVETLMPYGAFVSIGNGLTGLVHISQICQKRIKKPSEVLKEGQTVKVKILDTDNGKISLSMKALEDEMVDDQVEEVFELPESEATTTSLASLLKGIKL